MSVKKNNFSANTKLEWAEYIAQNHNSIFSELRRTYVLIKLIKTYISNGKGKITEVGCGSAMTSFALGEQGYSAFCLDNDFDVLRYIKEHNSYLLNYITICMANMYDLPFPNNSFNLAYSQGLLEHFQDDEIIESLKEQKRIAEIVIFDVPNKRHAAEHMIGDERLLSERKYIQLCGRANLRILSIYGRKWLPSLSFLNEEIFLAHPWMGRFFAQNSIFICS